MSGFLSPLWLFGVGSSNPKVSADAGLAIVGVIGPVLALPALARTDLTLAALPALVGNSLVPAALSALVGDNGPVAAHSVLTGAIYG
jgi:hypothetical protein